ncbi:MAG: TatD family hydrolase [Lentisphaeria bacterium]|nr:TatD family hydrolase [Lentisphaeria bacterium]
MQMLVDIHVHLADSRISDPLVFIGAARAAGVGWLLGTATRSNEWDMLTALAARFPVCDCALGIHPWHADEWSVETAAKLQVLGCSPRVVAIGEIGLDFGARGGDKDRQLSCFEDQVMIARDAGKPVVLHVYKAWPVMRGVFKNAGLSTVGGVWHGFTGGPELAREALDVGLHVSFGGAVLETRNRRCRSAAAYVPEDRLLVESDGPDYPVYRDGAASSEAVSESGSVVDVYRTLADLRGVSVPRLAAAVARNAARLFGVELGTAE